MRTTRIDRSQPRRRLPRSPADRPNNAARKGRSRASRGISQPSPMRAEAEEVASPSPTMRYGHAMSQRRLRRVVVYSFHRLGGTECARPPLNVVGALAGPTSALQFRRPRDWNIFKTPTWTERRSALGDTARGVLRGGSAHLHRAGGDPGRRRQPQGALAANGFEDGFMTAVSPAALPHRQRALQDGEEFIYACADAMREESRHRRRPDPADDTLRSPRTRPDRADRVRGLPEFTQIRVERQLRAARPAADRSLPPLLGSWHGPHTTAIEFRTSSTHLSSNLAPTLRARTRVTSTMEAGRT